MTARRTVYAVASYGIASALTAAVAFLASIPYSDPLTVLAVTADAAAVVGFPALLAADRITNHRGGAS